VCWICLLIIIIRSAPIVTKLNFFWCILSARLFQINISFIQYTSVYVKSRANWKWCKRPTNQRASCTVEQLGRGKYSVLDGHMCNAHEMKGITSISATNHIGHIEDHIGHRQSRYRPQVDIGHKRLVNLPLLLNDRNCFIWRLLLNFIAICYVCVYIYLIVLPNFNHRMHACTWFVCGCCGWQANWSHSLNEDVMLCYVMLCYVISV